MQRRLLTTAALSAAILPMIQSAQAQSRGTDSTGRELALAAGAFAMQTSRLAQSRGQAPGVKQFAELEAEEQAAFMEALRLVGVDIPTEVPLDPQKAEMMRRLRGAQGEEFDRTYLAAQLTGHRELLQIHGRLAGGSAGTSQERALSTVAVPSIKTHIVILERLNENPRG